MTAPVRHIAGNLVWTAHGTVLAIWRITPASSLHASRADKLKIYHATRGVLGQLRGDAMLLSLTHPIDPVDTVARMVAGVDLERHPDWVAAADATLDLLGDVELFDRTRFLAAALPPASAARGSATALAAAAARVGSLFGLPAPPPSAAAVTTARQQEQDYLGRLGAGRQLRRATAGDIAWIYARLAHRGLFDLPLEGPDAELRHGDPDYDPHGRRFNAESQVAAGRLVGPSLAVLDEALTFEGGDRRDPRRPERMRRYLQVDSPAGTSYQAFGVLADMPDSWSFPDGAEWFAAEDAMADPIDWYARIRVIPNVEAKIRARRKMRQLVAQQGEYVAETAGAPTSLGKAIDALGDEQAELDASPDPVLATTLVFSVAGADGPDVDRQIGQLQSLFGGGDYRLVRPIGDQQDCYEAAKPGSVAPRFCRDFEQMLTPRQLAAGNPFAGVEVGDPGGILLGFGLDGGTARPVFLDPARGPSTDRSGSIALVAALGAGKSFTLKHLAWGCLARGGQFATLDRTEHGEWVQFADAAPGSTQVVALTANAAITVDPLQIFGDRDDALQYAAGFFCLLLGIGVQEPEGDVLTGAIKTVLAQPAPCAADLLPALDARAATDRGSRLADAAELVAGRLRARIGEKLAHVIFGDAPPLQIRDADSVIIWTPGLKPPPREVLLSEQLSKRLLGEQLLAQAMVYLSAAIMRKIVFADRTRFGAMCLDEVSFLNASVEGAQLVEEGLRECRRANAGLWIAAQDVESLGEPRLRALIPTRIVGRQGSRYAAEAALELLGMDVDEDRVAALQEINPDPDGQPDRVGECYLRDLDGRLGFVQIVPPPLPGLTASWNSNPNAAPPAPAPPAARPDPDPAPAGVAQAPAAPVRPPVAPGPTRDRDPLALLHRVAAPPPWTPPAARDAP